MINSAKPINDLSIQHTLDGARFGRGRDKDCSSPPAQIRTCGFPAYGSHLGFKRSIAVAMVRMRPRAGDTRSLALGPERALLAAIPLDLGPSLHQLRSGSLHPVRRLPSYYGLVRLPASVHHRLRLRAFPMRTLGAFCHRPDAGYPSFRRDPSARDVLFDPGRVNRTLQSGTAHVAFDR